MDDKQLKDENDFKTLLHVHELLLFPKLLFCRSFFLFLSFFALVTCSRHNRCVRTACVVSDYLNNSIHYTPRSWLVWVFYCSHSTLTPIQIHLTCNWRRMLFVLHFFFSLFDGQTEQHIATYQLNGARTHVTYDRTYLHAKHRQIGLNICVHNKEQANASLCRYDFKPNRRCTQLRVCIIIFLAP